MYPKAVIVLPQPNATSQIEKKWNENKKHGFCI